MKICTDLHGHVARDLNASGLLHEPVLAAGHVHQGRAPSMLALITGWALVRILVAILRRSRTIPRHALLAVTPTEVVALKVRASGGGEDSTDPNYLYVKEEIAGRWARSAVTVEDLGPDGPDAREATLVVGGERIAVMRPQEGDPNTAHLLAVLAGLVDATVPPEAAPEVEHDRPGLGVLDLAGLL